MKIELDINERGLIKSCLSDRLLSIEKHRTELPFGSPAYNTVTKKGVRVKALLDRIPLFEAQAV